MDFVVRHGLPGTPNRLTTNGGRRRGCAEDRSEGWVLLALWFDTTVRRLPGGSPRTGWGRRLARRLGCRGLCGSTRSSGDSKPAHHERGATARVRRGSVGRLGAAGFVVRRDRPKTPGRLTTNGVGAGDWLGRLGVEGCVVRHDSFDRLRTGSSKTAGRLTTNGVGPASLGGKRNVRSGVSRPGCRAQPVGGGRLPRKR